MGLVASEYALGYTVGGRFSSAPVLGYSPVMVKILDMGLLQDGVKLGF